jgi:dienelactone hydrolase
MRRALVLATVLAAPIFSPPPAAHRAPPGGSRAPEIVQIKTSDGQTLQGSFYKPGGGKKPVSGRAPSVLLVHEAGGKRGPLERALAERLCKEGFGVLSIDLRGHGGSATDELDWEKLSESERKATWSVAAEDLDAAAKWLLKQPSIQSTSLSLVAYSSGCALAVRHAKSDEAVVCLALVAPNAQDYGFDVQADIRLLAGLDTFVVASKNDAAERMVQEANAACGTPFMELFVLPDKLASPLENNTLPAKVTTWVGEKALPKRGRG